MGKEKKSLKKKHSRLFAFYGAAALAVLFYGFSACAEGLLNNSAIGQSWNGVLRMCGGLFLHNGISLAKRAISRWFLIGRSFLKIFIKLK